MSYPYTCQTKVPDLETEQFNGMNFYYMLWPSQSSNVKGRVLIVHGFGEYTGIYHRLMDQLSLADYESFCFDQRGSGKTSNKDARGLTDEYHTFNDLEHFVEKNLQECKKKNIPLYLWGHSMGGGIVLNYAGLGKHRDEIKSFIVSGPLVVLHPHTQPNLATRMVSPLLAKFLSSFRIDTGLDPNGITSDERYREFMLNDPMTVPLYGSFRQIYDFLQRGKNLYNNKDSRVTKISKPIFIQHGKDDTINDPKGSQKVFDMIPASTDKKLTFYPGARHSILSLETDEKFDKVYQDLLQWLNTH